MPASPSSAPSYELRLEEIKGWVHELDALHARIAPRFERFEPRRRALRYLKGLLRCSSKVVQDMRAGAAKEASHAHPSCRSFPP